MKMDYRAILKRLYDERIKLPYDAKPEGDKTLLRWRGVDGTFHDISVTIDPDSDRVCLQIWYLDEKQTELLLSEEELIKTLREEGGSMASPKFVKAEVLRKRIPERRAMLERERALKAVAFKAAQRGRAEMTFSEALWHMENKAVTSHTISPEDVGDEDRLEQLCVDHGYILEKPVFDSMKYVIRLE